MIEETQENIVQSETPVAQVAGVTNTPSATEPASTEPASKWAGISNVEQSTDPDLPNTVAKDNSQAGTDAAPISKWAGIGGDDSGYADPTIIRDKELEIDLEDYTSYLGNDIYNPVGGIDTLNKSRAINQSWYDQAGNMLGQAVVGEIIGGTIEGIGYVLDMAGWADIAKGEEGEWGNWLSDYGKSLREFGQESMPIYQVNEGEFDMGDSGWWFSNAVSVASSLSMLIPATGTVKALSFLGKNISKALGAINKTADIAAGMGKKAKWMANGISQAVVSRHIENHMEASGTFESTRDEFLQTIDPKTGVKFTEEEAKKYASQAAASNYKMGWAMIMQDIPQYLAIGKIFNPRTMKMESALSKATGKGKVSKLKPWQSKGLKGAKAGGVTFLSEGAEESYQYYIAERGSLKAKLDAGLINEEEYKEELSATIGDTEMMTSAFWGGLGGNVFQAVGPKTQTLFKNKATRQSEANWAKMQADFLEKRGASYEMMQKELAVADQNNDPVRRKQIVNEMMIGMSLEALTVDQFEQHIESLANLAEMTAEEQDAYKKEHGIELDIELFKEYVPDAIRIANETKQRYLKHLDKNDAGVAGMMASNDIHIAQFQERIEALEQEKSDMTEGFVGSSKMSTYAKEIPQKKALIKAYQRANEIHRANLSDKASDRKKKLVGDVVKNNEKYIESLENSIANDYKEKEDIHPETTMHNKRYAAGHQTMLEEKQDKEIEKILLEDGMSFRQSDNAHLGSDVYKKERQIKQDEIKVALIQDEKGADEVRKNIRDNNEYTDKEKKDLLEKVDAKKKAIIAKKKAEDLKAAQVLHDKKLAEEAAATQEANPGDLVDTNVAPIEENIEDEFSEEESDHVNSELEKSEKVVEESAGVDRAVKLLDTVASDGYKEWVANGKSKIDEEVGFVVADYNGQNANILKAIELFNKGIVNDFVYEYLPIKALVGNNPDVFTFLPTLTGNIARNEKAFDAWNKRDLPQRKVIIDLLKDGKPAKSKISQTSGGGLVMDKNEDGSPAKNILTDLDQVEDLDDIQLAITNKDGDLVDSDTRAGVAGFKGKKYMVTGVTDEKGNQIPYKGGVFLMVKKADGSSFPLRLNLSKHSNLQAEALTEVLAAVALGQVKLEQAITDLPKEVLDILEVNLVEELKIVEDGNIKDLINLLGYTSEQTKGKKSQLMFSKDYKSVLFGDGKVLSKKNLAQAKIELQEFLQTTKNINFNSELWKTSPEYREWVVGSGAISTNATTKGPMFATSKDWKTKVFVAPIDAPAPAPKVEVAEETPAATGEQAQRREKTKKAGITKGENGIPGFTGYYYNQIGGVTAINDSTKEAVYKRIEAKYDSENITVKPTSTKSEPETDARKQERINRSKASVSKSTMGLPGFEGVYYGIDGRTLTVNLSTKKAVNEWIDNKFKAEPKTNPMPAQKKDLPKTTPTQKTSEVKEIEKKDLSFKKGKLETFTLINKEEVKGTAIIIEGQPNINLFAYKDKEMGWVVIDNKSKKEFPLSEFSNGTKNQILDSLYSDISKEGIGKEVLESMGLNFGKPTQKKGSPKAAPTPQTSEVAPTNTPGKIDIPKYKTNKNLKNQEGTKVYASTNGKDIQINPVTDQQDFYDYIEGKGDYVDNATSRQKVAVMKELADQGYSPAKIRSILSSKKDMNTFLILHEQDHIDNNDKAVYWKNGKDLMTADKIKIETRATLVALKKIEESKSAIVMATESELSPDQKQTIKVISEIQEESKEFGLEEVTIDGVVHSVYVGQGKTLERQSNMVTRLKGEQSESNDAMKKGAAVGNFVDILARDIFGDTNVKSLAEYLAEAKEMNKGNNAYLLEVTEQEFDGLVRKINKVKTDLTNKGMTFVSEEVFVYREYNQEQKDASGFDGMGGTLDLVAVDRQGKMHIIDFKNIKYSDKNATFLASNIYGPSKFATKNEKWSAQQTVYADASYNKYGLDVSDINILPISATYEEKDGTISMDKFELTNTLIGTTPISTSSLSDSIIKLEFDNKLQEKLDGMFSDKRDTPQAGDGLKNILNATDESRDKLSARVDKEVERLEKKDTRSARRRRRSNDKNSQENLEANNNSRIFEADDLSAKLNNSQKTINDPKPGKDTGTIRKKCD